MDRYVQALLDDQSGTVARQQLVARGIADHEIRRWVRRRELARVHRGVFVNHTGDLTWLQSAWCAVLATSAFDDAGEPTGSALARESALRLLDGPGSRIAEDVRLQVVIDNSRFISGPAEIALERCRHLNERVTYRSGLPCVRYEEALIDVATGLGKWDSFALLANAVTGRKTTVERLADAADRRNWMHQRDWFMQVVDDVGNGTCSVLERGFVTEVLRPHALPRPRQQSREVTPIGVAYRDALFGEVVVELDGRAFHADSDRRDADLDRDLVAALAGLQTVRLGWGQIYGRPCQTALFLARLLGVGAKECGPRCALNQSAQGFGQ